nr:uncharacterized protein LOC123744905 [Procambarus clarkii]
MRRANGRTGCMIIASTVLLLALTAVTTSREEEVQEQPHRGSMAGQDGHHQVLLGLHGDHLSKVKPKLALDPTPEDDYEPNVSQRWMVEPSLGSSRLDDVAVARGTKTDHEYDPPAEEAKTEAEGVEDERVEDERVEDERVEDQDDSVINDEEFSKNLDELGCHIKNFLHREEWRGGVAGAREAVLNFPQATLLASLVGLGSGTWANTVISVLFFGWPFLLLLLYVALIFVYPNRKSDNAFEKHMSSMIESWSHLMYSVEDNFLQFMEDVTDPGEATDPHYPKNTPAIDYHDRMALYFGPTDYHDDGGDNAHTQNTGGLHGGQTHTDRFQSPAIQSTFVDPSTDFINPVMSFRPEHSEPLRSQYNGDISRLTNDYNIQNKIAQKDRQNFVNVVLEAQFQHAKPSSSLADHNVVRGSVSGDVAHHPQPPEVTPAVDAIRQRL